MPLCLNRLLLAAILLPAPLFAQDAAEFLAMRARFGQINTVAGSGAADSCNDWLAGYEGGSATAADLSRPHIAIADADGGFYIADKEAHAIRRVDLDGTIHTVAGNGTRGVSATSGLATDLPLLEPNGLWLQPDGSFYLLEINDDCAGSPVAGGTVRKVTPDGQMAIVLADPQLLGGRGLWVSPDEATILYGSATVIRKWTATGGTETFSSGYVELGNFARAADGTFIVTDRGSHTVWRLQPDGSGRTRIAGTGATSGGASGQLATSVALNEVRGVAVFASGGYLLCTHRDSQVWYVDTAGYAWLFIDGDRSDGTHAGDGASVNLPGQKISEPRAVTIAPSGDLLITENDRGFVRRVTHTDVPPVIVRQAFHPGVGFELEWRSQREGSYAVERSPDLSVWASVPISPGNGATTVFLDQSVASETYFYYRVRETD